jgi:arginyl-tRNA synthetase
MDIFNQIRALVLEALDAMVAEGLLKANLDYSNVAVEPPRDPAHGDMATNAALVLAKLAKIPPREIAEILRLRISTDNRIKNIEVAGPGFLNIQLNNEILHGTILRCLSDGEDYGKSNIGKGKRVNIEYVSANPTGPLHVGHTRGAVFGDALANLLKYVGYEVTREYYLNDGGAQVDVLARSVYLRYLEAHGLDVTFEDGTYPGDYLIEVGTSLKDVVGDKFVGQEEEKWLDEIRVFAVEKMVKLIQDDLKSLGVTMDFYFSEKSLFETTKIEDAIGELDKKGLIYEGILEAPKGKLLDDWEPRQQTLFKSTNHGDDVDRPVKKSDGSWTYFAPDIAYHYDKVTRGYDHLINVFGADHGGYVKRMKAAVLALSGGGVELDVKLIQLVRLYKDGEPFKMSKRSGTFVTLKNLIEEVGSDVVRFVMLTRKNDAPLDFDFSRALEQSKDNPVFYVQYAHARICSIIRKSKKLGWSVDDQSLANADFSLNSHPAELSLIKKISEWPRLVEIATRTNEPHRVCFYLYDLAGEFHSLWSRGNELQQLRFIQENKETSLAKIALARSVAIVISSGLSILGVEPSSEMR